MKQAKRIAALLLTMVMVLALCASAFAAGETTGTITINNALPGNTYTIYKIFDLDSYTNGDATTEASYAYTITSTNNPLYTCVSEMARSDGSKYFALDKKAGTTDVYYVSLSNGTVDNDSPAIKEIASKLMTYIDKYNREHSGAKIPYVQQIVNLATAGQTVLPEGTTVSVDPANGEVTVPRTITFSGLNLGYYLVDSTAGTMLGLTTTNPNGEITAKNELPGVDKEVKRNVDTQWGSANAKKIGETVEYRVQVGVKPGATNYVIYDSISDGLTFKEITKVYYGDPGDLKDNQHLIYQKAEGTNPGKGTIGSDEMNQYFKYTNATDTVHITYNGKNCCFKMEFEDKLLNQVLTDTHKDEQGYNKIIYVEYTAVLNENAVIGDEDPNTTGNTNTAGNTNDVYLTYGENDVEVGHDQVTTYTYEMELVKTKADKTVLNGAQFEVYDTEADATAGTKKIHFVKDTTGTKTIYRVATAEEIASTTITTVTTIDAGDVIIKGLGGNFSTGAQDEGRTYYFKETQAPAGYNLLSTPQVIRIGKADQLATVEAGKWVSGGLQVINNPGTLLPSTGGIGTTIFYVVGGILAVGAVVLLVTKRRMNAA